MREYATFAGTDIDQRGVVRKTEFFVPIQMNKGNVAVIYLGVVCDLGAYEENSIRRRNQGRRAKQAKRMTSVCTSSFS